MQNIHKFEKDLKIKFKNKSLIIEAFTHKSANQKINNEKLEFLGDRVLGLILSKKLFDLYPKLTEGVLDKKFASLVNRKTCCDIAWSIGIQNYIITGDKKKKITKTDEKILSDCCEAIIGAIYLDQGLDVAERFIVKFWKNDLKVNIKDQIDAKTKLQEYSLKKYKSLPKYKLLRITGKHHKPIFKIGVSIENSKTINAVGNSKKDAGQKAATLFLKKLGL